MFAIEVYERRVRCGIPGVGMLRLVPLSVWAPVGFFDREAG